MPLKENYWFSAKKYGYGWGLPARWQGWLVLIAYVAAMIVALGWWHGSPQVRTFVPSAVGLTAVFMLICWWKGEPPRWRWGKD